MKFGQPISLVEVKGPLKRRRGRFIVEYRLPHYRENLWVVMTRVDTKEEMKLILKRRYYDGIQVRGRTAIGRLEWAYFLLNSRGAVYQTSGRSIVSKSEDLSLDGLAVA